MLKSVLVDPKPISYNVIMANGIICQKPKGHCLLVPTRPCLCLWPMAYGLISRDMKDMGIPGRHTDYLHPMRWAPGEGPPKANQQKAAWGNTQEPPNAAPQGTANAAPRDGRKNKTRNRRTSAPARKKKYVRTYFFFF
jgi:hypothetical protein